MKLLKFSFSLVATVILLLSFPSCKKDSEPVDTSVKKEQLLGKWDMVVQSGGTLQTVTAELKGSGAMGLDMTTPADGVNELMLLWDTQNNTFNAHLDIDSVPNAYELHGNIDPVTLGIAGTFKLNDPQSPQTYIFTMDKQH